MPTRKEELKAEIKKGCSKTAFGLCLHGFGLLRGKLS